MTDQELQAAWTKWLANRAQCRKELMEYTARFRDNPDRFVTSGTLANVIELAVTLTRLPMETAVATPLEKPATG